MGSSLNRIEALRQQLSDVPGLDLMQAQGDLAAFQKDAFEYSPVLKERLDGCRADLGCTSCAC